MKIAMEERSFDVVIVGGGPTGLWLGAELRLAGLAVCILERRKEPTPQSRALTMHGRTLDMLALRGLAERFLACGKQLPTGHFAVLPTRLDFSGFDTRHPFSLFIPQSQTERLLEAHALELGVTILRGWRAAAVGASADGAWVEAVRGNDPATLFRGRWVAGADGARSIVRQAAGIDFPGIPAGRTFMLGDVRLDMPPQTPVIAEVNAAGAAMVAPLGDGCHHRIVLFDPGRAHVPTTQPLALGELLDGVRRTIGTDLNAHSPVWLSRFSDETRLAARYRLGRIFVVGDAAHMHAPMGGQGMNVGLQDAMNLGWKLAAVARGRAPEALLDSYEAERRPVGELLYRNTLAQTALTTTLDPATLALRSMVSGFLREPRLNREVAAELSGFGVRYPQPLLDAGRSHDNGAGTRVADTDLVLDDGRSATLFGLLGKGKWVALGLDGHAPPPVPAWLAPECVDVVRAHGNGACALPAALLVRPDGYCESRVEDGVAHAARAA